MSRINCKDKAALSLDSSIPIAISDELAAIYDHMEHCCRNAGCQQAKAFFDGIQSPHNTLPNSTNRSQQLHSQSPEGRVTMRFHAPEFQNGATWPREFLVKGVIIRTDFSPDIPCSFEQDDTLSGRGAVVIPLEEDPKLFLTFSPKVDQNGHSTNVRASQKRSDANVIFESVVPNREDGGNWRHRFTGWISIELYKRWPPLALIYEDRKDWFGGIELNIHSKGVDPKCFLTFSSTPSSADHNPHSPAPDNCVLAPTMTIAPEITDEAGTSVEKNIPRHSHVGSVKRKLSCHGLQFELRRSERLAKKAKTKV